jgi:hypothetical protein
MYLRRLDKRLWDILTLTRNANTRLGAKERTQIVEVGREVTAVETDTSFYQAMPEGRLVRGRNHGLR